MATEIWSPFGNVEGYLSRKYPRYELSGKLCDGLVVNYSGPDSGPVIRMYLRATLRAWIRAHGIPWLRPPHAVVEMAVRPEDDEEANPPRVSPAS